MTKNHVGMSSDEVLQLSLFKFFKKRENIDKLLPILTRTSIVSLRLLDYFCVSYSKSKPICYVVGEKYFDAYSSYKTQLSNFSKKRFDPFRRNDRTPICYNGKKYITTIAQLCFFKWCITYNIIEYVEKHKNEINEDMKNNNPKNEDHECTRDLKKKRSRKKSQLTAVATRVYENGQDSDVIIVSFD
jgi:hypothetical protein